MAEINDLKKENDKLKQLEKMDKHPIVSGAAE